jgi:hypothetical protein
LKAFSEPNQLYPEGKPLYFIPVRMGCRVPAYHDQGMHRQMSSLIESGVLHRWSTWLNDVKPQNNSWNIFKELELSRNRKIERQLRPQTLSSNIWSVFVVTFIALGLAAVLSTFEMGTNQVKH